MSSMENIKEMYEQEGPWAGKRGSPHFYMQADQGSGLIWGNIWLEIGEKRGKKAGGMLRKSEFEGQHALQEGEYRQWDWRRNGSHPKIYGFYSKGDTKQLEDFWVQKRYNMTYWRILLVSMLSMSYWCAARVEAERTVSKLLQ